MALALSPVVFLNAVTAAGSSAVFPLDWNYHEIQQRSLCVSCVASDVINTEVSVDGGNSWYVYHASTGPVNEAFTVLGPFTHIRVTKVGANGVGNARGII